ncbi:MULTISPECIES: type IV pilus modification protein PilV [Cupriavidus]|uniref:Type IV pilus modification protein PilV n=1 Tax=Cupriavidus pauculus TaxID=82633 RepID=A0A5P2H4U6_9BURK|nr:type IV pilus modification protein PilV [Cupriavidus pauculus]QET02525.1 type IV pilus modification protein PilV [Cupriavidus pauculus]
MTLRRMRIGTGFTMIESLVAVLVLGIGVLGVANLLANSLRFSQQSTYELVASSLAHDMAERMRANAARVRDGGYRAVDTATFTGRGTDPLSNGCTGQDCASRREQRDVEEWSRRVTGSLPGGRGVVCADAAPRVPVGGAWACTPPASGVRSPLVIKLGWVPRSGGGNAHATGASGGKAGDGEAVVQLVVVTSTLAGP